MSDERMRESIVLRRQWWLCCRQLHVQSEVQCKVQQMMVTRATFPPLCARHAIIRWHMKVNCWNYAFVSRHTIIKATAESILQPSSSSASNMNVNDDNKESGGINNWHDLSNNQYLIIIRSDCININTQYRTISISITDRHIIAHWRVRRRTDNSTHWRIRRRTPLGIALDGQTIQWKRTEFVCPSSTCPQ